MTVFNLRKGDDLMRIELALKSALASIPEMEINYEEIDLVPAFSPDTYDAPVARVDVDLWEREKRSKENLQELARRMAVAFRDVVGVDRQVKVVLKPYDVTGSGWVSL